MREQLVRKLAAAARRVLARERPEVIAVTGSVGKSSTKQALFAVLRGRGRVRATAGNMNTEIGLPLTVLDLPKASSPFGWLMTGLKAWSRSLGAMPDYPQTLVLEMGADRPGDIARLCDIAAPRVGVVTAVGEAHLERFEGLEAVEREKGTLIARLPDDGLAILNRDDDRVWRMRERTAARAVSFGYAEEADVRILAESVSYVLDGERVGTRFKVAARGSTVPMFLAGVGGRHVAYAAAAAVALGLERGMNLVEIATALERFEPVPGRSRILPGIKHSFIIDDTYNASPQSALAALSLLDEAPVNSPDDQKFAILGDMLELGEATEAAHAEVGLEAAKVADILILVGERMGAAVAAIKAAGGSEDKVFHFGHAQEAGRFVQDRMKRGDVILIKGSRRMEMERAVKELMAEPQRARELLVKFYPEWEI
jgi:UDP-N-acetylmuramoyl-tripeptide--D-alanyl-D-alanine ligase